VKKLRCLPNIGQHRPHSFPQLFISVPEFITPLRVTFPNIVPCRIPKCIADPFPQVLPMFAVAVGVPRDKPIVPLPRQCPRLLAAQGHPLAFLLCSNGGYPRFYFTQPFCETPLGIVRGSSRLRKEQSLTARAIKVPVLLPHVMRQALPSTPRTVGFPLKPYHPPLTPVGALVYAARL
jgi:hypothetical protein